MNGLNDTSLAIIPARGGSTGIPRKNIADICGKPLIAYTIEHAQKADTVDHVVLSSEDKEIRNIATSLGAQTMDRPDEFAHDKTWQEVDRLLIWTTETWEQQTGIEVGIVILLYPTAPLRDISSINDAVGLVRSGRFDSVLSLYRDMRYLWHIEGDQAIPDNYEPENRMPRQKEDWNQWAENKAIYAMRKDLLFSTGCRIHGRVGHVEMEKWRSIDIDTPDDLLLARRLVELKGAGIH